MDDPDPEFRSGAADGASPPAFDELTAPEALVRGERTREDFFDAVLGLAEPATVGEVAELAGHGVDAAREYLDWFERMGIVTRVTDRPATYRRNQAYLDWRRVQRLREEYTDEELVAFLDDETGRAAALADRFDADVPDEVSVAATASERDTSVTAVWETVAEWRTARRNVRLLERALDPAPGEPADRRRLA